MSRGVGSRMYSLDGGDPVMAKKGKVRCEATTKEGKRCKNLVSAGSKHCASHKRK